MNKVSLINVVGSTSIIGDKPMDERCWSGSGRSFFQAQQRHGMFGDAVGVEVPKYEKVLLAFKNFQTKRADWFKKLVLDPQYYSRLTHHLRPKLLPLIAPGSTVMQIGAIYDVPSILPPGVKCVSYHDGNVAKMMTSPFFNKRLTKYAERAFKWEEVVYGKLDHIFTMSEYLRQSMIHDFGVAEDRVTNAGVGVNFDIPSDSISTVEKNPQDLVFVGREFERKGGLDILKAFTQLRPKYPKLRLHVIGPTKDSMANLGADLTNVVCHGFLNRDVPEDRQRFEEVLSRASIGVFPTLFDAFGIPVLEMFSYEIPCIATNILAMPEMVTPHETGFLVDVYDGDNIARWIEYYISHPEKCREHGRMGRQLTLSKYTWDVVVEKIQNVLKTQVL